MKYIFVVGAPGSKWSSVAKSIYYSSDVDRSDYSDARTYCHGKPGNMQLMHIGSYFDPGMEFGAWFDKIADYSAEQCEEEFNKPFTGTGSGIKIIKSHVLALNIDFLKQRWPECPVVLVTRSNDACIGWWVRCGQFNITYPDYREYYRDLPTMCKRIDEQNGYIHAAWHKYYGREIVDSYELADACNINATNKHYQHFGNNDTFVKVI